LAICMASAASCQILVIAALSLAEV